MHGKQSFGQEQEPFWLIAGNVALSNLSVTPPSGAQWWTPERTTFIFVRHGPNMERPGQTEMTSPYFSFQARLARLRQTGEIHPAEYGAGVGSSEYLKVTSELKFHSPRNVSIRRLQNLLISKRLYASGRLPEKSHSPIQRRDLHTPGARERKAQL